MKLIYLKWYQFISFIILFSLHSIQDVDDPFQMVTHNGRNLTLTPGIAEQVAALPVIRPMIRQRHAANENVNAQAGPSRSQIKYF
jgi:hypothetical protein